MRQPPHHIVPAASIRASRTSIYYPIWTYCQGIRDGVSIRNWGFYHPWSALSDVVQFQKRHNVSIPFASFRVAYVRLIRAQKITTYCLFGLDDITKSEFQACGFFWLPFLQGDLEIYWPLTKWTRKHSELSSGFKNRFSKRSWISLGCVRQWQQPFTSKLSLLST